MSVWQQIRRPAKIIILKILNKYSLFRYQYFNQTNQSQSELKANLLVVKNSKYSELAQLCVFSFLHYHPYAKVKLHCDEATFLSVTRWVKKSRFSKLITVKKIHSDASESWQLQKLKLLFSLSGTSEIFIDADMRWNAPLKLSLDDTTDVFFFVKEFDLSNNKIFSHMLSNKAFQKYGNASMFNSSFVCLSGLILNDLEKQNVLEIQQNILVYAQQSDLEDHEKRSMVRISEQLALSLAATQWGRPLSALKEIDGCKDGSFLESSYFGATGFQF